MGDSGNTTPLLTISSRSPGGAEELGLTITIAKATTIQNRLIIVFPNTMNIEEPSMRRALSEVIGGQLVATHTNH